jgi:hypothetical protein
VLACRCLDLFSHFRTSHVCIDLSVTPLCSFRQHVRLQRRPASPLPTSSTTAHPRSSPNIYVAPAWPQSHGDIGLTRSWYCAEALLSSGVVSVSLYVYFHFTICPAHACSYQEPGPITLQCFDYLRQSRCGSETSGTARRPVLYAAHCIVFNTRYAPSRPTRPAPRLHHAPALQHWLGSTGARTALCHVSACAPPSSIARPARACLLCLSCRPLHATRLASTQDLTQPLTPASKPDLDRSLTPPTSDRRYRQHTWSVPPAPASRRASPCSVSYLPPNPVVLQLDPPHCPYPPPLLATSLL